MVAAPLDPEQLLARADLAGEARVVKVAGGRARLHFTRLTKARPRGLAHRLGLARTVDVVLRQPAEPMRLGDWSDAGAYRPGARLAVHLAWNAAASAYESVWWNAVDVLKD